MPEEPYKVVVIDDTPVNLKLVESILKRRGFQVLTAEDGPAGLNLISLFHPDIILLDLMMPGIDGFAVCRKIQESPETRMIPVMIMTAIDDIDSKVSAFDAGAVDYITKPIQEKEMLARLRTHLELGQLRARMQEEIAAKDVLIEDLDTFAHTVAHDLKNPLNNTLASAETLAADGKELELEPAERTELIQEIHRSCSKMSLIINELLLLAGARGQEIAITRVSRMELIIHEAWGREKARISADVPEIIIQPDLPSCLGYPPWLEEVWANLVSNAIKYGGTPPRVEVGGDADEDGEYAMFWVRDNGEGLSMELRQQLFKPFTRLQKERSEGTGLGLTIVKKIIERLNGRVGVESEPGQGCSFYFLLPMKPGVPSLSSEILVPEPPSTS